MMRVSEMYLIQTEALACQHKETVIPANDPRFNLKIPQSEMQANKSLQPGNQNP